MNGFEASEERHNELRQERLNVQKKTFTKWANIHLQKHSLQIDDLFQDLGDGKRLMKLLESITGEKLGRPTRGSSRINKIENVSRCLAFLHSKKMRLENISSEDIVDGKPHLILGLLWTIILRCEIWNLQATAIPDTIPPFAQTSIQPSGQKIAKDSLLLWCQTKTDGYPGVKVRNFGSSWRNGLPFHALIHSHLPNIVEFNSLKPKEHVKNLSSAFDLALRHIGVPKLLDPEDVDTDNPDEKSILIYVSTFCKGLANIKKGMTGGKRIANIVSKMMEIDKLKGDYEHSLEKLLKWISNIVAHFQDLPASHSLEEIHEEITKFKIYRTEEKPQWYESRNDSEAILFSIQMQLKSLGQVDWIVPDGRSPADIEKAWSNLETSEHEHELKLREQLKYQEHLENLAYKFESKRSVRDSYLKEMQKVLTDPKYGANVKQVDATFKKHEAVRTGVLSREAMFQDLFKVADVLIEANYRRKEEIVIERDTLEQNWNYVKRLLEAYDETFENLRQVVSILDEINTNIEEMQQVEMQMRDESEPLDVEGCLQEHALIEVQLSSWGNAVNNLNAKVEAQETIKPAPVLQTQLQRLQRGYINLLEASKDRRQTLETLLQNHMMLKRLAEIEAWIGEMRLHYRTKITCRDLPSALHQLKKHKSLGSELALQKELAEDIPDEEIAYLRESLLEMQELWERKFELLSFSVQVYEYLSDADESGSWISEKIQLMESTDFGKDELTCQALYRRHAHMELDINVYATEVQSLRSEAIRICAMEASKSYVVNENNELLLLNDFLAEESKKGYQTTHGESATSMLVANQIQNVQSDIENFYGHLNNLCEKKKRRLQIEEEFFRFCDTCDEIEAWLTKKEGLVENNVVEEETEEVEKYVETLIADMLTHNDMVQNLEKTVLKLEEQNFDRTDIAKSRITSIQERWQRLTELKSLKEHSMKGFTGLVLSQRLCEETRVWINEKINALSDLKFGGEINNLHNLQRKHEQLQRELIPVEEKMKRTISLTEAVATTCPKEKDTLLSRVHELKELWVELQGKTDDINLELNDSVGYELFKTNAEALMEWAKKIMHKMAVREKVNDVSIAESIANDHRDDGYEVATRDEQFNELIGIGMSLQFKNVEVEAIVHRLEEVRQYVQDAWQEKEDWIRQCLDKQIFNREANLLDSLSDGYKSLLEKAEVGKTLGDVEIQLKHHETLIETLKAQDNRYAAFSDMADKLIAVGHSESSYIDLRREQVLDHRREVKEKCQQHRTQLIDSFEFEFFKANAHELQIWIDEKAKLAQEMADHDVMMELRRKMKRQQTFQAELSSNEDRLEIVNTKGQALILESRYAEEPVIAILEHLNASWNRLCTISSNNERQLIEAHQLQTFEKNVENMNCKLSEVQKSVDKSTGHDFRSTKQLLKEQEILENEYEKAIAKVEELVKEGEKIISEDHFAGDLVKRKIDEIKSKMASIQEPISSRRKTLEFELKCFNFLLEVDCEMLWIAEHQGQLSNEAQIRNLLEAQKRQKKIESLEVTIEGHKAVIDKLLDEGQLLKTHSKCPQQVSESCDNFEQEWKLLIDTFEKKKTEATFNLKVQMFMSEIADMEYWTDEKHLLLSSDDYGKDENAVIKLLTNHKALELDIDSYSGLLGEISNQAEVLIETNCIESSEIKKKTETVNQEMKKIQDLCSTRRQKLLESKNQLEFYREAEELEMWIREQMVVASSEDYGEDYEHILEIQSKFEFFRAKLEAGTIRVMQFEEFANKLIASDCYFADDVKSGLQNLSQLWSELVETADERAFKMEAAAEIHRYHRDVTDVLSRIHDNYRGMNTDLGNNLVHVQDLIKKEDVFEHDLLALEAQVHLLLKDSQRLQETYPGGNEEHIQLQLHLVIENWNLLEQKVSLYKAKLLASHAAHKFLSMVHDLETWAKNIYSELKDEVPVKDIEAIGELEAQHELLGAEIEARKDNLQSITEEGNNMLSIAECEHLHPQIQDQMKSLLKSMEKLSDAWHTKSKKISLCQNICSFFEEAKQMEINCSQKEVQLCGCEMRESVEDINSALKKHLEIQRTMEIQDQKFEIWRNQGENLVNLKVSDSEVIQKKISDLSTRRKRLWDFSKEKSEGLANALLYAKFRRNILEAESWVLEKRNNLHNLLKKNEELSIEDKVHCLQKQQALQAELKAHEPRMTNIKEQGEEVLCMVSDSAGPQEAPQVRQRLQLLLDDWEEVKRQAARIGSDLEEARHIVEFRKRVEDIETWLKEKELLIHVNDLGRDYEHCVELQRRLDDMDTKMDEKAMSDIKELAFKTSKTEPENSYQNLEERWTSLKQRSDVYRQDLEGASQVHSFIKDLGDILERVREKRLILSQREGIKDLQTIKLLRRKHQLLKKELNTIDTSIKTLAFESHILSERNDRFSTLITKKMFEVHKEWAQLEEQLQTRENFLDDSYTEQLFVSDVSALEISVIQTISEMELGEMPNDSRSLQNLLKTHDGLTPEIKTHQDEIQNLQERGCNLIQSKGIKQSLKLLDNMSEELQRVWLEKKIVLSENLEFQIFMDDEKKVDSWLSIKEAYFNNDDLGNSLTSVEALIRKHSSFEQSWHAYQERITDLENQCGDLLKKGHPESAKIQACSSDISQRRDELLAASEQRLKVLNDSWNLQQFLSDAYEVDHWLSQKIRVVTNDSVKDLTNLLGKSQKLASFETEILTNQDRVKNINEKATHLTRQNHFASQEILEKTQKTEELWSQLLDLCTEQKEHLRQANQAFQFKLKLEDLDTWIEETEVFLEEECAQDVVSLHQQIAIFEELKKEFSEQSETVEDAEKLLLNFQRTDHFMKDDMLISWSNIMEKFDALRDKISDKQETLINAISQAQLQEDVEEQLSWITEKLETCLTDDHCSDILSVQALQKQLQVLEMELESREILIQAVVDKVNDMMTHPQYSIVECSIKRLQTDHKELIDAVSKRKVRLDKALEAQEFYFEVAQAELWIKEKLSQVHNPDTGRNIQSVNMLIKNAKTIKADVEHFEKNIDDLQKLSSFLLEKEHFDKENIESKQDDVNGHYRELKVQIRERINNLLEKMQFFTLEKDVKQLIMKFKSMSSVVQSEDFGRNVEHVESLLKKLDNYSIKIKSLEGNVDQLKQKAQAMIEDNHSESENIQELLEKLYETWIGINESAQDRMKVLEGAKLVHMFNRRVDETVEWLHQKNLALDHEDYGHDLESIKTLLKHHDSIEGDLLATESQIEDLKKEAAELSERFPYVKDQIDAKHVTVVDEWNNCLFTEKNSKKRLLEAEKFQSYIEEARDFQATIKDMITHVTNTDLESDVDACQTALDQHVEYKIEIKTITSSFENFESRGEELITDGNFNAEEIQNKIQDLKSSLIVLNNCWETKKTTYEQNLDLLLFKRELQNLEDWLQNQQHNLMQEDCKSIEQVETLIATHDLFEKQIQVVEPKFKELERTTKIEEFEMMKRKEEETAKLEQNKQFEKDKVEELKRQEEEKHLEDRRKESDRAKAEWAEEVEDDYMSLDHNIPKESMFKRIGSTRVSKTRLGSTGNLNIASEQPLPVIDHNTDLKKYSLSKQLPPTTAEGFLERKQELQVGGKKSTSRHWKNYYTVLCGHLLCFFKDKANFRIQNAAKSPINISEAKCSHPDDYRKKKFAFRLQLPDKSSYLFSTIDSIKKDDWMQKLSFAASLEPNMQFKIFEHKSTEEGTYARMPSIDSQFMGPRSSSIDSTTIEDVCETLTERTSSAPTQPQQPLQRVRSDASSLSDQSRSSFVTAVSSTSTLRDPEESSEEGDWYSVISDTTPRGSVQWSTSESDVRSQRENLEQPSASSALSLQKEETQEKPPSKKERKWKSMFILHRK